MTPADLELPQPSPSDTYQKDGGHRAVASITALIEAGAKVAKYLAAVHGAAQQITSLEDVISNLQRTFDNFNEFSQRPNARLHESLFIYLKVKDEQQSLAVLNFVSPRLVCKKERDKS